MRVQSYTNNFEPTNYFRVFLLPLVGANSFKRAYMHDNAAPSHYAGSSDSLFVKGALELVRFACKEV